MDVVYYHIEITPETLPGEVEDEGGDEGEGEIKESGERQLRRTIAIISIIVIVIAIISILAFAMTHPSSPAEPLPETSPPGDRPPVSPGSAVTPPPSEPRSGEGIYNPPEAPPPGEAEEEIDLEALWREAGLEK